MKSKKLVSLLCASAMSVSAFAGLMVANAATEADIIWSDNFDGHGTGVIIDSDSAQETNNDVIPGMMLATCTRGNGDSGSGTYEDSDGNTVESGSFYSIEEKSATDKYFHISFPHFGDFATNGRWAYIDFASKDAPNVKKAYEPTDAQDVVMDFDLRMIDGMVHGSSEDRGGANPVLRIGAFDASSKAATAIEISRDDANIPENEWVHARIVLSKANGAKLYINQQEVTNALGASTLKKIETIGLYNYDDTAVLAPGKDNINANNTPSDGGSYADADKPTKTAIADIDNLVFYNEATGVANGTSEAPGAQSQSGATPPPDTRIPEPEKAAGIAPNVIVPDRVEEYVSEDFEGEDVGTLVTVVNSDTADPDEPNEKDLKSGDMFVSAGSRSGGGDAFASIVNVDNGTKALKFVGGRFSTGGRSPMLHLVDNLEISSNTGSAVMAFAVYLSKATGDENKARIWLLDTDSEGGMEGANVNTSASAEAYYKNVFAMITAEDEETDPDSAFGGDVTKNNKVLRVDPDMWHVITISVSEDKYRLFLDGNYAVDGRLAADLEGTNVNYGEGAAYMPINLPVIAIDNAGTNTPVNSKALIDNVVAYYADEMEKEWLPIVEAGEVPPEESGAPEESTEPTPAATPTPKPTMQPAVTGVTIAPVAVGATKVTLEGVTADTKAKLIHASYDADGKLTSVELKDAASEVEITAAAAGDKIAVWNALANTGMNPAADVVTVGGAPAPAESPAA